MPDKKAKVDDTTASKIVPKTVDIGSPGKDDNKSSDTNPTQTETKSTGDATKAKESIGGAGDSGAAAENTIGGAGAGGAGASFLK